MGYRASVNRASIRLSGVALALALAACKRSADKKPEEHVPPALPEPAMELSELDLYGDPLPPGAVARLGSLKMYDRALHAMIFSPDGSELVADTDEGFAFWKVADGGRDRVIPSDDAGPIFALSGDKSTLAAAGRDLRSLVFYDLATDTATASIAKLDGEVRALCYQKARVVAALGDGSLQVWESPSGRRLETLRGPWTSPTALACKDEVLAFGTSEGAVFVRRGAEAPLRTGSTSAEVTSVALSASGEAVAAGSSDGTLSLWREGGPPAGRHWPAHRRLVESVAFRGDNELLSSGGDALFRVWNARSGKLIREWTGVSGLDAQIFALSPRGLVLAAWSRHSEERGSEAGRWWLWSADKGTLLLEPERHAGGLSDAVFSPEGERVATSGEDGRVYVWDARSGMMRARLDGGEPASAILWRPDGGLLYAAGKDAEVRAWEIGANSAEVAIAAVGGAINALDIDFSARRAVTGDQIGRVWSWDLASGAKIQAHDKGGYSAVNAVALAPDGKTLAVAGSDRLIRVVDLESGRVAAELNPGDVAANYALDFSPDGRLLVTGGDDHALYLWNTADWTLKRSIEAHDGTVRCAAFSADGTMLASGGNDEKVGVWDVGSGERLHAFEGHRDVVTAVDFAPDGQRVVSASRDRSALVWRLSAAPEDGEASR